MKVKDSQRNIEHDVNLDVEEEGFFEDLEKKFQLNRDSIYLETSDHVVVDFPCLDDRELYHIHGVPCGRRRSFVADTVSIATKVEDLEKSEVGSYLLENWTTLQSAERVRKAHPLISELGRKGLLTWKAILALTPCEWRELNVPMGMQVNMVGYAKQFVETNCGCQN
eukprot:CAMPEP_0177628476 /NCGR_PEP_ID=MMETSP0447-20121125/153_1 /TAXON_ID=0 /ORGANISM="Stygamoeba regulata, Strain BSH-02190019" /LENGTH=166 /DNA_ID=CAMNT_0019129729 /DNA_START=218 /DNA_END=718 /DNA_ORIENTATION=+